MTSLYSLIPLLLIAIPHAVQGVNYVAEVYFVVEPQVVRNYQKLGYDKATAIKTIQGDFDFFIFEVNKYYESLQRGGLNLQIHVVGSLKFLDTDLIDDCKLLRGNELHSDLALEIFKEYLEKNKVYDQHPYDIAFLFTGYDLFGSKGKDATIGYATVGAVCDKTSAVGTAEFSGTQSTIDVIAHELGHSLGSEHDANRQCTGAGGYIMKPTDNARNKHRWQFSTCSINFIKKNIQKLDKAKINCLTKTTSTATSFDVSTQAGRDIMDPEKICQRFRWDKNSYFCSYSNFYHNQEVKGDLLCQYMFCGKKGSTNCRMTDPTEWMPCDIGKRCQKGKCVTAPSNFPIPSSMKKGCLFGDIKSGNHYGFTGTCEEFLTQRGLSRCYGKNVRTDCCNACGSKKYNIAGCEYGDKSSDCSKYSVGAICPRNKNICCYKCRNYHGKRSETEVESDIVLEVDVDGDDLYEFQPKAIEPDDESLTHYVNQD